MESLFRQVLCQEKERKMSSEACRATAAAAAAKKLNLDKATNFMRQFRDPQSRELKRLSANQFMEVWSHYDKDEGNIGRPDSWPKIREVD
ncbi:hypothetical protein J437_LFUL016697 [Ladona fulva]|uniref:Uncharacterized protein n=1 Tax=Ladona fulva TaxID=123851 RepID=A0A8K0P8P2_LADFU|nr:hypothetical protein J437_LFUL016697 [Ladona fulva]